MWMEQKCGWLEVWMKQKSGWSRSVDGIEVRMDGVEVWMG